MKSQLFLSKSFETLVLSIIGATLFFQLLSNTSFVGSMSDSKAQPMDTAVPLQSNIEKPSSCEDGRRFLDESLLEIVEDSKKVIIVVLRPGSNEKEKIVKTRASILENFCNTRGASDRCVISIGKTKPGLGSGDIYVNGTLFRTIHYEKSVSSFCDRP